MDATLAAESLMRCRVQVRGQVQGVGFRPFVFRLAQELGLSGWVRNCGAGVELEVQGHGKQVDSLLRKLRHEPPPLARIAGVSVEIAEVEPERGFAILESRGGETLTRIAPDTSICPDCLAELFTPGDRRYRYPFINCTHCGPRYTLAARVPYDRAHTAMAKFPLCPACQTEYHAPDNRRFHAEATACPVCGPQLALLNADGSAVRTENAIASAVAQLKDGKILAVKGLGGFHLMCDANNPVAVARLRERKAREEKPFAVMALNAASLEGYAKYTEAELALLESPARPVVILERTGELQGIADGMPGFGAMLPYTPLHYLLFHEAAGSPAGRSWLSESLPFLMVCTSANPGGEPLVYRNDEAVQRLNGIADGFLIHDRDILVRADDCVMRVSGKAPGFVRRSRGYTPSPIALPLSGPPVLAVGGFYKNAVCVTRGSEAFLSQHIGELDNAATCEALEQAVWHLLDVLEIRPELVVHDLHPDFFSSRFAARFAAERGIPALAVQHHHAHIGAVAAEHGVSGPLLGLALDGVGLGTDGSAWGGELLRVDGARKQRLGSLDPLALPGGDAAAREPWRMAAAALHALGRGEEITQRFAEPAAQTVAAMLEHGANVPYTSSCGRLFDAAAALLRVKNRNGFEGQAAMLLEGLAAHHGRTGPLQHGFVLDDGTLSFLPLLDHLADMRDADAGAALFHATLAEGLAAWVVQAARQQGLRKVALGGGCFLNAELSSSLEEALREEGITVLRAEQAPPNDGGLALGQAWIGLNFLKD
ncbi:carbamoyltransferase HypF [Ferrigenium kumadai]|uniref:Carbamoyltransferase HypF n=1 Tax=Ferrigenium kumadai TaxID=1682490 RepID=A0AAN1T1Q4_9PROT|nr:carbamoyltransferase HypF [Ferrigenium kumadai]BBI99959.1 carbamoyltransferase HypF [Ferrigenium kumadai]